MQNLQIQEYTTVEQGQIQYISAEEAVKQFEYLYNYDRSFYVRGQVDLTQEELTAYEIVLTMPKNDKEFYIQVDTPFLVWKVGSFFYVINGNSRLCTISWILSKPQHLEVAPIPYRLITTDLSKSMIERLQYNANDTTRKHRTVDKLRRIQGKIDECVRNGMSVSTARQYICKTAGVSQQTVTDAKELFTNGTVPQELIEMLDNETATTDGAVKLLQACKVLNLPVAETLTEVLYKSKKQKLNAGAVKRWRESYVASAENADKTEVVLEKFLGEPETKNAEEQLVEDFSAKVEIKEFEPEPEKVPEPVVEIKSDAVKQLLNGTNPSQSALLLRIAASLIQELPEEKAVEHHEAIKTMISALLSDESSQGLLAKIQKTLG